MSEAKEVALPQDANQMALDFFQDFEDNFEPTSNGDGTNFLGFSGKSGRYSLGDDDPAGRLALFDFTTLKHGYRCWVDGKPVDELVSSKSPKPKKPAGILDSDGDMCEYKDCYVIKGQMADGDREDFQFSIDSWGGRSAVETMLKACRAQAQSGAAYIFPIVELGEEKMGDEWGNYKPVFSIVNWITPEGEMLEDTGL